MAWESAGLRIRRENQRGEETFRLNGNSLHRLDIEDDTTETIGKPVETLRNNIEKFQSSSDIVYFGFIQCGMRAQYIGFTILENQYASFLIYSYGTDLVQLKRINGKWE